MTVDNPEMTLTRWLPSFGAMVAPDVRAVHTECRPILDRSLTTSRAGAHKVRFMKGAIA